MVRRGNKASPSLLDQYWQAAKAVAQVRENLAVIRQRSLIRNGSRGCEGDGDWSKPRRSDDGKARRCPCAMKSAAKILGSGVSSRSLRTMNGAVVHCTARIGDQGECGFPQSSPSLEDARPRGARVCIRRYSIVSHNEYQGAATSPTNPAWWKHTTRKRDAGDGD